MNADLEIFNFFVDDLLSSDADLLNNEIDILLMQYLFNSIDLNSLNDFDFNNDVIIASQVSTMKYFYEKFWIPFFGSILSKFVYLIEGKSYKLGNTKKKNIK